MVTISEGESKARSDFANEYLRTVIVRWADEVYRTNALDLSKEPQVYVGLALEKGYLTKRTPHTLTAKGFSTAASFLRR